MLHTADTQQNPYVESVCGIRMWYPYVQLGENSQLSLMLWAVTSADKPLLTSFPSRGGACDESFKWYLSPCGLGTPAVPHTFQVHRAKPFCLLGG